MTYSYFFGTEKTKICQATGLSGRPVPPFSFCPLQFRCQPKGIDEQNVAISSMIIQTTQKI
jgi:hypothetical protein